MLWNDNPYINEIILILFQNSQIEIEIETVELKKRKQKKTSREKKEDQEYWIRCRNDKCGRTD